MTVDLRDSQGDVEAQASYAGPPEGRRFVPATVRHTGAFVEMLVSSIISLVASLVLSVEAVLLAADPDAVFSCDVNSKISCGVVAQSWQASLLGFPNAFLGLIAEPVVITIAVASLLGVVFPRRMMLVAQAIYTIGLAFAYWLFYEAYFVIGALCPWCLTVTATTTLVFFSMTRVNILDGNIRLGRYHEIVCRWLRLGADTAIAVLWIGVIVAMIVYRYL
jgi:uncharacterized membrane protein